LVVLVSIGNHCLSAILYLDPSSFSCCLEMLCRLISHDSVSTVINRLLQSGSASVINLGPYSARQSPSAVSIVDSLAFGKSTLEKASDGLESNGLRLAMQNYQCPQRGQIGNDKSAYRKLVTTDGKGVSAGTSVSATHGAFYAVTTISGS
jgi:hypothetical protein